ncbi:hypothetical protein Brsp07_04562 [Brucella sp. NBRC 14130]|uniref:hypothetical protein n=1 Tax=Brucella sp. NBRC 14130 TaxID=3075483 RepID=UPI0030AB8F2F
MKKGLGFASIGKEDNVAHVNEALAAAAQMKPQPVEENGVPSVEAVQRAVDAQAGTIPQTPLRVSRKRQSKGIIQPLGMRVRLATYNRYVELSKTLRLPYDETLEWLMEKAGVDHEGRPPQA